MNCFHSLTPNISLNSELNSHVNVINVNEPGLQQTIAEKIHKLFLCSRDVSAASFRTLWKDFFKGSKTLPSSFHLSLLQLTAILKLKMLVIHTCGYVPSSVLYSLCLPGLMSHQRVRSHLLMIQLNSSSFACNM